MNSLNPIQSLFLHLFFESLILKLTIRSTIKAYLLAGKLLHFITLIEIVTGYILLSWLKELHMSTLFEEGLRIYVMLFICSLPMFAQFDARSRYQNYKQVRDQFYVYGFDKRILNPLIKSRCQRDAAILAARDTGYKLECLRLFRSAGYRWYHLFPDFVFSHPGFIFTRYFWRSTFFCPRYRVKYFKKDNITINKDLQFAFAEHG